MPQIDKNILWEDNLLTFKRVPGGMSLIPSEEGIKEAKGYLADREERIARKSGFRGKDCELHEMLEQALCNGWSNVPPEDIGALTDCMIISEDGFHGDDGKWYPHPDAKRPKVYAHMNYAVEDPIETWAEGKAVHFVGDTVTLTKEGRKVAREKHREVCG